MHTQTHHTTFIQDLQKRVLLFIWDAFLPHPKRGMKNRNHTCAESVPGRSHGQNSRKQGRAVGQGQRPLFLSFLPPFSFLSRKMSEFYSRHQYGILFTPNRNLRWMSPPYLDNYESRFFNGF